MTDVLDGFDVHAALARTLAAVNKTWDMSRHDGCLQGAALRGACPDTECTSDAARLAEDPRHRAVLQAILDADPSSSSSGDTGADIAQAVSQAVYDSAQALPCSELAAARALVRAAMVRTPVLELAVA